METQKSNRNQRFCEPTTSIVYPNHGGSRTLRISHYLITKQATSHSTYLRPTVFASGVAIGFHFNKPHTKTVRKIQGVFKKDETFAINTLFLIIQHFKHCPLQSSPFYWRYTVPNVSSIVGILPGTHFLWWRV